MDTDQILFNIQFDGSYFYGWQKQKDVPSVQAHCEKILKQCFQENYKKIISCSRTDAKVHASDFYFILFTHKKIKNDIFERVSESFTGAVKIKKIIRVDNSFNIINGVSWKEYWYHFKFPRKGDSPYYFGIEENLDVKKMAVAASLFKGTHCFMNFQYKGGFKKNFIRSIDSSSFVKISPNHFIFRVKGKGFLRHQVRIMAGALVNIGNGRFSLEELSESLREGSSLRTGFRVPGEGLYLKKVFYPNIGNYNLIYENKREGETSPFY